MAIWLGQSKVTGDLSKTIVGEMTGEGRLSVRDEEGGTAERVRERRQ